MGRNGQGGPVSGRDSETLEVLREGRLASLDGGALLRNLERWARRTGDGTPTAEESGR